MERWKQGVWEEGAAFQGQHCELLGTLRGVCIITCHCSTKQGIKSKETQMEQQPRERFLTAQQETAGGQKINASQLPAAQPRPRPAPGVPTQSRDAKLHHLHYLVMRTRPLQSDAAAFVPLPDPKPDKGNAAASIHSAQTMRGQRRGQTNPPPPPSPPQCHRPEAAAKPHTPGVWEPLLKE